MRERWVKIAAALASVSVLGGTGIGFAMAGYVGSAVAAPSAYAYAVPDQGTAVAAAKLADDPAPAAFTIDRGDIPNGQLASSDSAAPQPYRAVVY